LILDFNCVSPISVIMGREGKRARGTSLVSYFHANKGNYVEVYGLYPELGSSLVRVGNSHLSPKF